MSAIPQIYRCNHAELVAVVQNWTLLGSKGHERLAVVPKEGNQCTPVTSLKPHYSLLTKLYRMIWKYIWGPYIDKEDIKISRFVSTFIELHKDDFINLNCDFSIEQTLLRVQYTFRYNDQLSTLINAVLKGIHQKHFLQQHEELEKIKKAAQENMLQEKNHHHEKITSLNQEINQLESNYTSILARNTAIPAGTLGITVLSQPRLLIGETLGYRLGDTTDCNSKICPKFTNKHLAISLSLTSYSSAGIAARNTAIQKFVYISPETIATKGLEQLERDTGGKNVVLVCQEGQELYIHDGLLRNLDYCKKDLRQNYQEGTNSPHMCKDGINRAKIALSDHPVEIVQHLVDFLYGKPLKILQEHASALLNLAQFVQCELFLNHCQNFIIHQMGTDTSQVLAWKHESGFPLIQQHVRRVEAYVIQESIKIAQLKSQVNTLKAELENEKNDPRESQQFWSILSRYHIKSIYQLRQILEDYFASAQKTKPQSYYY